MTKVPAFNYSVPDYCSQTNQYNDTYKESVVRCINDFYADAQDCDKSASHRSFAFSTRSPSKRL